MDHGGEGGLVADDEEAGSDGPDQKVQGADDVVRDLPYLGGRGDALDAQSPGGQVIGQLHRNLGLAALVGAHRRVPVGGFGELTPYQARHGRLGTSVPSLGFSG